LWFGLRVIQTFFLLFLDTVGLGAVLVFGVNVDWNIWIFGSYDIVYFLLAIVKILRLFTVALML